MTSDIVAMTVVSAWIAMIVVSVRKVLVHNVVNRHAHNSIASLLVHHEIMTVEHVARIAAAHANLHQAAATALLALVQEGATVAVATAAPVVVTMAAESTEIIAAIADNSSETSK